MDDPPVSERLPFLEYLNMYKDDPQALFVALFTVGVGLAIGMVFYFQMLHKKLKVPELEEEDEEDIEPAFKMDGSFNSPIVDELRKNQQEDFFISREEIKFVEKFPEAEAESDFDEDAELIENEEKSKKPKKKVAFNNPPLSQRDLGDAFGKLHGKLATAELRAKARKFEQSLTQDQRAEEARARAEQLESIFKMMLKDEDKFGLHDKEELQEQMKLYNI